jgi:hypothetical protein
MKKSILLAASAAAVAAAPAAAQKLKDMPSSLDPAKAYVFVEYKLEKNPLGNVPGSRKYMPFSQKLVLARYDPVLDDLRGKGKAKANPAPPTPQPRKPYRFGELVKGETSRLFLLELEPDTWVVQGWGNTSFSLGSYEFTLEPGSINDLGVVEAESDWAEGDRPPTMGSVLGAALAGPFAKRPPVAPARLSFRPRTAADIALPASLPAGSVRQVMFTPNATFGNYLGGLVNRIEGVNARLKAEQSASPTPTRE